MTVETAVNLVWKWLVGFLTSPYNTNLFTQAVIVIGSMALYHFYYTRLKRERAAIKGARARNIPLWLWIIVVAIVVAVIGYVLVFGFLPWLIAAGIWLNENIYATLGFIALLVVIIFVGIPRALRKFRKARVEDEVAIEESIAIEAEDEDPASGHIVTKHVKLP